MYDVLQEVCGDLLPVLHCPPAPTTRKTKYKRFCSFCPVSDFVKIVEDRGDTNNRYRAFSIWTRQEHLYYFDELCFCLRRVAFPLEMTIEGTSKTAREILKENRAIQIHRNMAFEGSIFDKGNAKEERQRAFKWCNFAFFPDASFEAKELPKFDGATNASPYMMISESSEDSLSAIKWISRNAFPKRLRDDVQASIDYQK